MSLLKEFTKLTTEYDNSMFEIFKNIIDNALKESEKNNMDAISTFIFVNTKIKYAYTQLALATGIITKEENYNNAYDSFTISEKLLQRIYTYLEPIVENAKNTIISKVEIASQTKSFEELQKNYNSLLSLLSNEIIQENNYIYIINTYTDKENIEDPLIYQEISPIKKRINN